AYLSDCSAVPDPIIEQIAEVELLVIDALRHKPHPTHLSVAQALEVAAKVRSARTLFTHVCHELPQASEAELPPDVGIAYDGLKVRF
ncbi:MAG: phosphoribosyl 1,2-cyclic phosphate phosphodiesterase, partial [Verrucomicrobiota bacterium]